MSEPWACRCHGRPFIHQALTLHYSTDQYAWAYVQAQKFERTYKENHERKSDFTPDPKWAHRGPLAEIVFAQHFGLKHTVYRDVGDPVPPDWDQPDIEPDIEVRATLHQVKLDRQQEMALALLEKDRFKVKKRRWMLATVRYATSDVLYWGWRHGKEIALADPNSPILWTSKYGTKKRIAVLYPDELAPMEDLISTLK